MKKYFLFLDDIRHLENMVVRNPIYDVRKHSWAICRNYPEFVKCIKTYGVPHLVSFDHDIEDEHYSITGDDWNMFTSEQLGVKETGYDCAVWLKNYCNSNGIHFPQFIVHSANPTGRRKIQDYLTNTK